MVLYRSKSQKHDCVHVEVFLGGETGEATIGSRYFRGKVGIFPGYTFHSTAWSCDKILFRSLDNWLSGECVSHCSEHPWIVPDYTVSKKSIFDPSEEDVSAGGEEEDDDEPDEDTGLGDSGTSIDVNEVLENNGPDEGCSSCSGCDKEVKVKKKRVRSGDKLSVSGKQASLQSTSEKKTTNNIPPNSYFVGKSNGWALVKSALDKHNWQQIPFEYKFSTRYSLKWVERRGDIDYKAHMPGQLVCHIPNNDCITTKTGLLSALRLYAISKGDATIVKTPGSPAKRRDSESSTLRSMSHDQSRDTGKPGQSPAKVVKEAISSRRRERGNSDLTLSELPISSSIHSATYDGHIVVPWLPDSFMLDSPADCQMLVEIEEQRLIDNAGSDETPTSSSTTGSQKDVGLWIYKPSSSNRGRGIKVIKGLEMMKELCYGIQTDDPDTTVPPARGIIQRYLENPLLIPGPNAQNMSSASNPSESSAPGGHKFDIRCFLLIARNDPKYLAYYYPGYCRLTLVPYTSDTKSLDDASVHLTNASVQKKGTDYQAMKEYQVF